MSPDLALMGRTGQGQGEDRADLLARAGLEDREGHLPAGRVMAGRLRASGMVPEVSVDLEVLAGLAEVPVGQGLEAQADRLLGDPVVGEAGTPRM